MRKINKINRRDCVLTVFSLLLLLITACGKDPPRLGPINDDGLILAFGNSLTYGTGAEQTHSYPAELALLTGRKVINAGVPGELSSDGLTRLTRTLDRLQPDLIILCHGANDILRKKDRRQMAENLRAMVRLAQQQGADVILIGVPKLGLAFLKTDPVYEEIALEFNLPYQGTILAELERQPKLKSDQIHPNAAGYKQLANAIYAVLRQNGAL